MQNTPTVSKMKSVGINAIIIPHFPSKSMSKNEHTPNADKFILN